MNYTWECLITGLLWWVNEGAWEWYLRYRKIVMYLFLSWTCFLGYENERAIFDVLEAPEPLGAWRLAPSGGEGPLLQLWPCSKRLCWCSIFKRRCPWPGKLSLLDLLTPACCGPLKMVWSGINWIPQPQKRTWASFLQVLTLSTSSFINIVVLVWRIKRVQGFPSEIFLVPSCLCWYPSAGSSF